MSSIHCDQPFVLQYCFDFRTMPISSYNHLMSNLCMHVYALTVITAMQYVDVLHYTMCACVHWFVT
jgi:hypothetical protein